MVIKSSEMSSACPLCTRKVFAAEEKIAGGHKWHKACFKCSVCNKRLDSTLCNENEGALFCKTCYGRKLGPKGYGYGGGAGTLNTDSGNQMDHSEKDSIQNGQHKHDSKGLEAPQGQGCPACSCFVYHADQVFSKGQVWHKQCFKCSRCSRFLDSRIACDGPDKKVYCNICYRKGFGLKGYGFGQGGPALLSGDAAESVESTPATSKFVDTALIQADDESPGCPRCGGKVFHAEQMFSRTQTYHKKCFSCNICKRPLDSVLACDAPDKEIYCRGCYGKKFGAKGYGFAGGSGFLQTGDFDSNIADRPTLALDTKTIQGNKEDKETCPRCNGKVFHAEKMMSKKHCFHKKCFTCMECQRPLDSMTCCDSPEGEIFCKLCYGKNFGPHGYGFGGAGSVPALMAAGPGQFEEPRSLIDFHPATTDTEEKAEGEEGCKRCGYKVFDAEKLMAAGRNWHRRCFSCSNCSKHLDSFLVNDGIDGEIYCKSCHSGKFGLTGYGFGQGAGTLLSDGHSSHGIPYASDSAFILP